MLREQRRDEGWTWGTQENPSSPLGWKGRRRWWDGGNRKPGRPWCAQLRSQSTSGELPRAIHASHQTNLIMSRYVLKRKNLPSRNMKKKMGGESGDQSGCGGRGGRNLSGAMGRKPAQRVLQGTKVVSSRRLRWNSHATHSHVLVSFVQFILHIHFSPLITEEESSECWSFGGFFSAPWGMPVHSRDCVKC